MTVAGAGIVVVGVVVLVRVLAVHSANDVVEPYSRVLRPISVVHLARRGGLGFLVECSVFGVGYVFGFGFGRGFGVGAVVVVVGAIVAEGVEHVDFGEECSA